VNRSILKSNAPLFEVLMRAIDPLITVATGWIAFRLYPPLAELDFPEHYLVALLFMGVITMALFPLMGLYGSRRGITAFEEVRQIFRAVLVLGAIWLAFVFFGKSGAQFSRVWSAYWIALTLAGHLAFRTSLRLLLRQLRRRGHNLRHVVIVGAGVLGTTVAERLRAAPWAGFAIHGFYDDNTALADQRPAGLKVLGTIDRLLVDIEQQEVDQVWIALPLRAERRIRDLIDSLQRTSVQVRFVPDIYNFNLLHHSVSEIEGLPVINLTDSPLDGTGVVAKTIEDFVLAAVLALVALPAFVAIAIGVKLSSPGPVLFRQERVTWNGQRFRMLKFRTMPVGTEADSGPVWATAGEQRATRFGAFLRRFSLDELPQLLNVLRGEMSIVGPRPERPEFVARYKRDIPGYMQKHLVKAGITGWAQVNDLRGNTSLRERIQYDLYYIEHWSIWFDLRIIGLTLLHILRSENAY
jgi:putative colanic acid biosynthesis UDP-glucose lipid carrier transferase